MTSDFACKDSDPNRRPSLLARIRPFAASVWQALCHPSPDLAKVALAFLAVIAIPAVAVLILGPNALTRIESALPKGPLGSALFVLASAIIPALALIPSHAFALLGGYLFGTLLGLPLTVAGLMIGVLLGGEIGRFGLAKNLDRLLSKRPAVTRWRKALTAKSSRRATIAIALFRLSPVFPYAATNLALGAFQIPRLRTLLASFFGLLPRTSLGVFLGAQLKTVLAPGEALQRGGPTQQEAMWLIAFAVIGLIGLTLIARRLAPPSEAETGINAEPE